MLRSRQSSGLYGVRFIAVVWYFAFRLLANLLMSAAAASQYNCAAAATVIACRAIELRSGTDCALSFSLQTGAPS